VAEQKKKLAKAHAGGEEKEGEAVRRCWVGLVFLLEKHFTSHRYLGRTWLPIALFRE
jgi:hypothetical protein